jgi:hypothetical protein
VWNTVRKGFDVRGTADAKDRRDWDNDFDGLENYVSYVTRMTFNNLLTNIITITSLKTVLTSEQETNRQHENY